MWKSLVIRLWRFCGGIFGIAAFRSLVLVSGHTTAEKPVCVCMCVGTGGGKGQVKGDASRGSLRKKQVGQQ